MMCLSCCKRYISDHMAKWWHGCNVSTDVMSYMISWNCKNYGYVELCGNMRLVMILMTDGIGLFSVIFFTSLENWKIT